MTALPAVTAAEARKVWESFEKAGKTPSSRLVAMAFNQAGKHKRLDRRTVSRWAKEGWVVSTKATTKAMEQAQAKVDAAASVVTGDPEKRVEGLLERMKALREELGKLSDAELAKTASREGYITGIMLLRLVQEQPELLTTMPRELGTLQAALAGSFQASANSFMLSLDLADRLMKTIDHDDKTNDDELPPDHFADVMAAIQKAAADALERAE